MDLVGREAEIDALERALAPEGARVALVGPGGAGKTRLARSISGAVICELAGCRSVDDVLQRAAVSLEVDVRGPADAERLGDALGARRLVLDGCEPALDAVLHLLAGWRTGRVLLTSRVRPEGLAVVELGPLGLPVGERLVDVVGSEAGRLFLARARVARPGWVPDPAEGPVLAELLRRLDGLPLALELAAARLRLVGTRQLTALLDERFRLLTGPEGSMAAVLQASWDLLSPAERALLVGLSWFGGAFDLEAVESVSGGGPLEALERVGELVDHSLVRSWEAPALPGVRWFALYDGVRAFARRQAEPPSRADWLTRRAQVWVRALRGPDWRDATERLSTWATDLRVAFDAAADRADAEQAARAALALDAVYKRRGPGSARAPLLKRAHALGGPLADDVWLAGVEGRVFEPDLDRLAMIRGSARDHGDLERLAWASRTSARERVVRGQLDAARAEAELAVQLEPDEPRALVTLAEALAAAGDRLAAVQTYHRALGATRARGTPRDEAAVLGFLAMLEHELGHGREARELAERAIALLDALADPRRAAIVAQLLGDVALAGGDPEEAELAYQAAEARLEAVGEVRWRAWCRAGRAMARARMGAPLDEVCAELREASREARRSDPARLQGFVACWAAVLEARRGAIEEAEACLEVADADLPQVAAGIWVGRRAVELARANALRDRGDPRAADVLEVHTRALLATADRSSWTSEVRLAASWVDERVAHLAPASVDAAIARDGSWFEVPGGERVSLTTRHANRRVLERLVQAHGDGATATVGDLLAAGWPGERVLAEAGAARVYTAVATLRREGLKDLIEKTETGYAIRPTAVVEVT